MTSPESPTTKSVPIFRPSRPSRAISTARETVCSSTRASTSRFSVQISSYVCLSHRDQPPFCVVSKGNLTVKHVSQALTGQRPRLHDR